MTDAMRKQDNLAARAIEADRPFPMQLITSYMQTRVVHMAAELGVADHLADRPATADEVAQEIQAHAPSLYRLLRALVAIGLVEQLDAQRFGLTPMGAHLRSNVPGSLRNFARMFGGRRAWQSWGEFLHCIKTGESATSYVDGMGSYEYFAAHPEQAIIFNEAMAENTRRMVDALIAKYDFSGFSTVIDVGGGSGALLAAIVAATPGIRGVVFDLPSGIAEAPGTMRAMGVGDRCDVVAGDFFREVPKGADAYILKNVIHNWNDDASVAILKSCRTAMHKESKLLLMERVLPEIMQGSPQEERLAMFDMNMMVMAGGRERTEQEYALLFGAGGLALRQIKPLLSLDFCLIEAGPV
jgi:hypothetical protein